MYSLLFSVVVAFAEPDSPINDEPPLAIPHVQRPRAHRRPPLKKRPKADPDAMEAYQRQRLSIRDTFSTAYYQPSVSLYGPWWSITSFPTMGLSGPTPLAFQGNRYIDVPDVLELVGEGHLAQHTRRRIRRGRTAGWLLTALGVAGIPATVVGIEQMRTSPTIEEFNQWNTMRWGGIAAMSTGFIGSFIAFEQAKVVQTNPSRTLPMDELQQAMDEHNKLLSQELGLTQRQAHSIDNATESD